MRRSIKSRVLEYRSNNHKVREWESFLKQRIDHISDIIVEKFCNNDELNYMKLCEFTTMIFNRLIDDKVLKLLDINSIISYGNDIGCNVKIMTDRSSVKGFSHITIVIECKI